ncbi:MAG: IPT/TIG domain-containing protein [Lentimicrobiaceae bacterium]|jgi:N-acetylneuraminic acid mutarotase
MKKFILLFFLAINFILVGCKKDAEPRFKYPFLLINSPDVISNGVILTGKIISTNGFKLEEYGFVLSKKPKPVLSASRKKSEQSLNDGSFNDSITSGLEKGETYYVRAYLLAGKYIVYSNQESFISSGSLPPVISSFFPQQGFAGEKIEIKGANFGNSTGIEVKFGDVVAKIDSLSNNVIYVESPLIKNRGNVNITLTIAGMTCKSQDPYMVIYSWLKKNDYTGDGIHSSVYLSLNNKGYMIGGIEYNSDLNTSGIESQKVRVYDPIADSWTLKRNTPFIPYPRNGGFVINNIAYVSCADDKIIYKYNEITDTWSAETKYPGSGILHTNFVIDGSVYVGIGNKKFYKFNPVTKEWSQIPDFPGSERSGVISFSINGKGYVGMGYDLYQAYNDIWEYSPLTNSWSSKNNFHGRGRAMAISFIRDSKVYVGLGDDVQNYNGFSDIWEYQINSDSWIRKEDYIGAGKWNNVVFGLNNKTYIGMGAKSYGGGSSWDIVRSYKDLWEFNPNPFK